MKSERFTENDKKVLRGLCQQPWANDREIAEAEKLKMSTVTACKNRIKRDGIFRKAYFPAYHRLGYPVVSFSQLRMEKPTEAVLKAMAKYQDVVVNEDNKTVITFMVCDPLNAFVIANHMDYTSFMDFERFFGQDPNWSNELYTIEGATKVVDFNYTNFVNKIFFPDHFESYKPTTVNTKPFKFSKVEKTVFDGLLTHSEEFCEAIATRIGVTRQSVVKIMRRFRTEGILEKNTIPNFGHIGMQIMSVIKFKPEKLSNKEISEINKLLAPFYYWVFDKVHVLIIGNVIYQDLMRGLTEVDISNIEVQLFDTSLRKN